jgi:uncharacterized protein (TIGR03437 family)
LAMDSTTDRLFVFDVDGNQWIITADGWVRDPDFSNRFISAAVSGDGAIWGVLSSSSLVRSAGGTSTGLGSCCFGNWGDGNAVQSAGINPGRLAAGAGAIYVTTASSRVIRRISGSAPAKAPSIKTGGVVGSASYFGGSFAPGEIVTIFGDSLAYDTRLSKVENNQFSRAVGSTAIMVDGSQLPVLAVSPGQINAILPQNMNPGSARLQVQVDGVLSNSVVLPISAAVPALFTVDASGKGPGAIVNQDGTLNSTINPARRGSIVSLYGTGAGAMSPLGGDGYLNVSAPFGTINATVTASVGGQAAEVRYAGGAPFLVSGVFQMNIQIPADGPSGALLVAVKIGSIPANDVTVWIR